MIESYLNEELLGQFLKEFFKSEIIHNKKHELLEFKPDYFIPSQNLIVEFDGIYHFLLSKTAYIDILKEQKCKEYNIKMIRIPYFVQLDSASIFHYFNIHRNSFNSFPHGYITKQRYMPGDYCGLGYIKFHNHLKTLPEIIRDRILQSIINQMSENNKSIYECFQFNNKEILLEQKEWLKNKGDLLSPLFDY